MLLHDVVDFERELVGRVPRRSLSFHPRHCGRVVDEDLNWENFIRRFDRREDSRADAQRSQLEHVDALTLLCFRPLSGEDSNRNVAVVEDDDAPSGERCIREHRHVCVWLSPFGSESKRRHLDERVAPSLANRRPDRDDIVHLSTLDSTNELDHVIEFSKWSSCHDRRPHSLTNAMASTTVTGALDDTMLAAFIIFAFDLDESST